MPKWGLKRDGRHTNVARARHDPYGVLQEREWLKWQGVDVTAKPSVEPEAEADQ